MCCTVQVAVLRPLSPTNYLEARAQKMTIPVSLDACYLSYHTEGKAIPVTGRGGP
jgi:hypothetical protein